MDAYTRKRIVKYFHDFKAEMVAYLESDKFSTYDNEKKECQIKSDKAEQYIKDHPTYTQLQNKWSNADRGDHIEKVSYTPEEVSFMECNSHYLRMIKFFRKQMDYTDRIIKEVASRLKRGKASIEEQTLFNNAEMTIWENSETFFKDSKKGFSLNTPMISFDGMYYEILNYNWGNEIYDRFMTPLTEKLKSAGYYIEPYLSDVWNLQKL